jgi:hypothetical protein
MNTRWYRRSSPCARRARAIDRDFDARDREAETVRCSSTLELAWNPAACTNTHYSDS